MQTYKTVGEYIFRLVLATLISGVMYCMWQDAVSPAAQRIVQLVILFEYGIYFLSLVILFQVAPLRRWWDILLPPVIAIGFAQVFWELPIWLILGVFLCMVLVSALASGWSVWARCYRWLGMFDYSNIKKHRWHIGISLLFLGGISFLMVFSGMHGFPIYFIVFPFLIVLVYGLYCLVMFFYPVVLLLFSDTKRNWKVWMGLAIYTLLWIGLLSQTFPIRTWWMKNLIDPCYEETIGGRVATYEKLVGANRVCILPAGDGPFNTATRRTVENFDASQFVKQQQILDGGSLKTVYIPKDVYQADREREKEEKQKLVTEKRKQYGTEENRRMHIFQDAWVAEVSGYLKMNTEECPSWENCETAEVAHFVVTSNPVPEYIELTSKSGFGTANFNLGCDTGETIRYIPEQKLRSGMYQKITGKAYQLLKNSSPERLVTVRIDKPGRPDEFGTEGVVCMSLFDSIEVLDK